MPYGWTLCPLRHFNELCQDHLGEKCDFSPHFQSFDIISEAACDSYDLCHIVRVTDDANSN